jgi:hypothetical protein
MSALSDNDVAAMVAAVFKVATASLPSYYTTATTGLVPRGHTAGYQTVVGALLERGFTKAQVDAWDRLAEFEGDLSLWYILSDAGSYRQVAQKTLDRLDRRKELESVVLFVASVPVKPQDVSGATDLPSSGPLDTSRDLFVMDPDDRRLGETTRF